MQQDCVEDILASAIGPNKPIMHPREETEVSIAEKVLVAGCERQLLEVNILAIGVERLGMESALLCGCDNALQAPKCIRRALQGQLKCITRALQEYKSI